MKFEFIDANEILPPWSAWEPQYILLMVVVVFYDHVFLSAGSRRWRWVLIRVSYLKVTVSCLMNVLLMLNASTLNVYLGIYLPNLTLYVHLHSPCSQGVGGEARQCFTFMAQIQAKNRRHRIHRLKRKTRLLWAIKSKKVTPQLTQSGRGYDKYTQGEREPYKINRAMKKDGDSTNKIMKIRPSTTNVSARVCKVSVEKSLRPKVLFWMSTLYL